mmetsp:Transcript_91956/g.233824  ORF Transcript_91956/g.233824 Transcript_91956/m.233824 type:complete len:210 (-) Transcript_91956:582-1211(-)
MWMAAARSSASLDCIAFSANSSTARSVVAGSTRTNTRTQSRAACATMPTSLMSSRSGASSLADLQISGTNPATSCLSRPSGTRTRARSNCKACVWQCSALRPSVASARTLQARRAAERQRFLDFEAPATGPRARREPTTSGPLAGSFAGLDRAADATSKVAAAAPSQCLMPSSPKHHEEVTALMTARLATRTPISSSCKHLMTIWPRSA